MDRIVIRIDWCGDVLEVPAFTTATPGLVVTDTPDGWTVTHVPTGRSIGHYFDGPEQAMYAAGLLAELDWTSDATDYRAWDPHKHLVTRVLGDPLRAIGSPPIKVLNP